MINLKIGCIKILYVQDVASVNIGTAINLQNKSHTENYNYETPKESIPTPVEPSPELPGERPEVPMERPGQPGRQPPVPPIRPGPVGPP
jgi:hypothetical protein